MPFLNKSVSRQFLRRCLTLVGCAAALFLFLMLTARILRLNQIFSGMRQLGGNVESGTLAEAALARWMEEPEQTLAFWACATANFAHGYARGSLRFENASACPYTLVFELTTTVRGVQKVIYRSPAIPPGHCLNGAKLLIPLKKGRYEAVCVAFAYENDSQAPAARSNGQPLRVNVLN